MGVRRYIPARHRSGLEAVTAEHLTGLDIPHEYEAHVLTYVRPESVHRYTPDFYIPHATEKGVGLYIETKGYFDTADRQKHLLVRASNPTADIRLLFSRASTRISKQSKTTYAAWADAKGFPWAEKRVPLDWLREYGYHL